jgi:hypothetical protein
MIIIASAESEVFRSRRVGSDYRNGMVSEYLMSQSHCSVLCLTGEDGRTSLRERQSESRFVNGVWTGHGQLAPRRGVRGLKGLYTDVLPLRVEQLHLLEEWGCFALLSPRAARSLGSKWLSCFSCTMKFRTRYCVQVGCSLSNEFPSLCSYNMKSILVL